MHPPYCLLHLVIRTHTMYLFQCPNILLDPVTVYPILTEFLIRLGYGSSVDLCERCLDTDET